MLRLGSNYHTESFPNDGISYTSKQELINVFIVVLFLLSNKQEKQKLPNLFKMNAEGYPPHLCTHCYKGKLPLPIHPPPGGRNGWIVEGDRGGVRERW